MVSAKLFRSVSLVAGVALVALVALVGCAHDKREKTMSNSDTAYRQNDNARAATPTANAKFARVAKIDFAKGAYALSEGEKNEIAALIRDARANGEIDEVKVLAWADRDVATGNRKATSAEVELADNRAKAVRSYIREHSYIREQMKLKDIDTHNMAESPNFVSRLFKTEDYEMKTGMYDKDGARFNPAPNPQRVMVLLEMEDDND